jgi:hypothetical protein
MDALGQGLSTGGFDSGQAIAEHSSKNLDHLPVAIVAASKLTSNPLQTPTPFHPITDLAARSGEWLWGLFRKSADGDENIAEIGPSDTTEKNYPRLLPDGRIIWMQVNECDATEFVVEKFWLGTRKPHATFEH